MDAESNFTDDLAEDGEITYAVIANQPLDLQRETAIAFLNDLVGRQGPLAEIAADQRDITDLPKLTQAADADSATISSDTLRFSLTYAADALKTRAAGLGYRLEVRFQMDPLPRQEDVAARAPRFRHLYNTQDDVRAAVDSTVAMLGGQPMQVRGTPESARLMLQRHTTLLGVRQFTNQALRDADVTGNAFIEFGRAGYEPTQRCLRPEHVEIVGDDQFRLIDDPDHPLGHVLHLRGLEQFESSYGISPWEPLLYVVQRRSLFEGAAEEMRAVAAAPNAPEEARERASELAALADAVEADTTARLEQLLWFPRRELGEVHEDLYFSGQERFAE